MSPSLKRQGTLSTEILVGALTESFQGPAWHGPAVRTVLRGVEPGTALHRLAPGRNTIWEIVLHLAYSRHRVLGRLLRLQGKKLEPFPRRMRSSWWPELPDPADDTAWKVDRELLAVYQQRLVEAVAGAGSRVLARRRGSADRSIGWEVLGVAFHDTYHAGQIRLIVTALAAR